MVLESGGDQIVVSAEVFLSVTVVCDLVKFSTALNLSANACICLYRIATW